MNGPKNTSNITNFNATVHTKKNWKIDFDDSANIKIDELRLMNVVADDKVHPQHRKSILEPRIVQHSFHQKKGS